MVESNTNLSNILSKGYNTRTGIVSFCVLFLLFALFTSCNKQDSTSIPFQQLALGTNNNINAIHFFNTQNGVAVGGSTWFIGQAFSTTDGGVSWTKDSIVQAELFDFSTDNKQLGVTIGIGNLLFTYSGNQGWRHRSFVPASINTGIATNGHSVVVTSGQAFQKGKVITTDENYNVIAVDSFENEMSAVAFSDSMNVHAVGYGLIIRSTDAGKTWSLQPNTGDFYSAIHFPTDQIGYIVGRSGSILKTMDGGVTWKNLQSPGRFSSDRIFRAVYFTSATRGFIAGENGIFWQTENGGDDWTVIDNFPNVDLLDITESEGRVFVCGTQGTVLTFDL